MASCPEPCSAGPGGNASGREAGSICLRFGVRSYLHHFYEECSSSMWNGSAEDQGFVRDGRSAHPRGSAAWKVALALGLLLLGAGVAGLAAWSSGARRIESFGEGELFFVDADAVRHNQALQVAAAAGTALTCLGAVLALLGACLWLLPRGTAKSKSGEEEEEEEEAGRKRGGERGAKAGGCGGPGSAVTRAPGAEEGKVPVTLSKVEVVQPSL